MLHYVFWLQALASCVLFRFVPSLSIELFTLMLAFSYAMGIAALVHDARHPDPTATGAAAHASRLLLICMAPILLIFIAGSTGTLGVLGTVVKIAVALLVLFLVPYLMFCALRRVPPTLLTALLLFMFFGKDGD